MESEKGKIKVEIDVYRGVSHFNWNEIDGL